MTKIHLLVVEDDWKISAHLAGSIAKDIQAIGHGRMGAPKGGANGSIVDFVSLDVSRPSEDVSRLYRGLRDIGTAEDHDLVGRATTSDRSACPGGEIEAASVRPFELTDLVKHIQTLLQHGAAEAMAAAERGGGVEAAWRFCDHAFYPSRRYLLSPTGARIALTCAEADLLAALCQNARKVVSREELIRFMHGTATDMPKRSIDILVSRLRRKLSTEDPLADFIRTIRTGGYIFQPQAVFG